MGMTAKNIIEYILNGISIISIKEVIMPTIIVLVGGITISKLMKKIS